MANLSDVTDSKMFSGDVDKRFESIIRQMNENFRIISNEDRTKVQKDDAGTERLLTGYQQDGFDNGNVGIKLSQAGVGVLGATDNQLIFSSDFNLFKIVASGSTTLSPPASWADGVAVRATIPHGLSVTPSFQVYVDNPNIGGGSVQSGLSNLPSFIYYPGGSGGTVLTSQAAVDGTNLYIDLVNMTGLTGVGLNAFTWSYKYYIIQETAT